MRWRRFLTGLLLCAGMVMLPSTSHAADWYWIYSDDETGYFVDASGVSYVLDDRGSRNRDVIECWQKYVYTQKGANRYAENMDDAAYEEMSYQITHTFIHLREGRMYYYDQVTYDAEGHVLDTYDYAGESFTIIPDSIGEMVMYVVHRLAEEGESRHFSSI